MNTVNFVTSRQAAAAKDFIVTLPSTSLGEGSTYTFGLRVESALGVSGEASIEVFKSAEALPALKVRHELIVSG